MAFNYNPNTHYTVGVQNGNENITGILPITRVTVQSKNNSGFDVNFPNDFLRDSEYRISIPPNAKGFDTPKNPISKVMASVIEISEMINAKTKLAAYISELTGEANRHQATDKADKQAAEDRKKEAFDGLDEIFSSYETTDGFHFYQNQINFAVWCASVGCGVGMAHLQHKSPFIRSLYRFHLYYQVQKIMKQLVAPLPGEESYNKHANPYDPSARDSLFAEFGLSREDASKFKLGSGSVLLYGVLTSFRTTGDYGDYSKHSEFYKRDKWVPGKMTFGPEEYRPGRTNRKCGIIKCTFFPPVRAHVVSVVQPKSAQWRRFILTDCHGFTAQGVARINDSIRTYVSVILGAQATTRSPIVGSGSFDAQRKFINLTKEAINSPFDIGKSVKSYQDSLQYAGSAVNYSFGHSLYMAPSDMLLRMSDNIIGYNNNITISGPDEELGLNEDVNVAQEDEFKLFLPDPSARQTPAKPSQPAKTKPETHETSQPEEKNTHETNKMLLVATAVGIFAVLELFVF